MSIELTNLFLQEVVATNHFYRGYVGHAVDNQHNIIMDSIENTNEIHKNKIELSRLAPSMITLDVPTKEVIIPHGWGEKRYAFTLLFKCFHTLSNTVESFVMTGWTDIFSLSAASETIDDRTIFNISTITSTGTVVGSNKTINKEGMDILAISGHNVNNVVNNTPSTAIVSNSDVLEARAEGLQPQFYHNRVSEDDVNVSSLDDKTPAGYVKALFQAIEGGVQDSVAAGEAVYDSTKNPPKDHINVASMSVLSMLNAAGDGSLQNNKFGKRFLDSIDPTLMTSRKIIEIDHIMKETDDLNNTTMEASIATSIHHHISSIATKLGILTLTCSVTNMLTQQDQMNGLSLAAGEVHVEISYMRSSPDQLQTEQARVQLAGMFSRLFSIEAGPFLTQQGTVLFRGDIDYNRHKDTSILVYCDGAPFAYPYVFATFAAGLISPLLSADKIEEDKILTSLPASTNSLTALLTPITAGYNDASVTLDRANTMQHDYASARNQPY